MFKKLIYIFCFTFWLVPKLSAQENFLEVIKHTSVIYDFSYELDHQFKHYLPAEVDVSFMDSITIYKWDVVQNSYTESKRLRYKYNDLRKCYSVEVIDLNNYTIIKKAIMEMQGYRPTKLSYYELAYSETNPYYAIVYDLSTPITTFYQENGLIEHHTNYQKNEIWKVFRNGDVGIHGGYANSDWFKDSISRSTYHHSESYNAQNYDGNFYERQFYNIRNFDDNSVVSKHGSGHYLRENIDYIAIDSNSNSNYSIAYKQNNYWILNDSLKKEFRNIYANLYIDNYIKLDENWDYQYTDTMLFGYLYKRKFFYYAHQNKPSVLDIYQKFDNKYGSYFYAGATVIPTTLLNNFVANELDSLCPQYSIYNPIDIATPSRIMHSLAGVNVRYIGETIDFPRDKEFDDNEQEIIAEYKVVMHYTNIGSLAGNQEVKKNVQISVYPNPVNNMLHIELPNTETRLIEIVNLSGAIVASQNTTSSNEQINVGYLSSGLYVLRCVNTNGEITNTKFMKQ